MIKKTEKKNIYTLLDPENPLPTVFDSPHSGNIYPDDFGYDCSLEDLRRNEDAYIDELFNKAPRFKAPLLCALFPRSYIDPNRTRNDIDENMIEGSWPKEEFGEIIPSKRSYSGIGLISRTIGSGAYIYRRKLDPKEIMNRIRTYYDPYHDILRTLLERAYSDYGQFWHINLHSMPANSAYPKRDIKFENGRIKASDIVLGDLDGSTCNRDFINGLKDFWKDHGYRVTINDPFKGVEIISRYSQPTIGKNSVQIEINRSLYMNEKTGEKSPDFNTFKDHCTEMIQFCSEFALKNLSPIAAD